MIFLSRINSNSLSQKEEAQTWTCQLRPEGLSLRPEAASEAVVVEKFGAKLELASLKFVAGVGLADAARATT